jgi:hypothetical protein
MPTGATGVRGLQGLQGPYGPRGPTGLLAWNNQPYINKYGINPTGPTGTFGSTVEMPQQTITDSSVTYDSGSSKYIFNLGAPGTMYTCTQTTAAKTDFVVADTLAAPIGSAWYFKCGPTLPSTGFYRVQVPLSMANGLGIYINTTTPTGSSSYTQGTLNTNISLSGVMVKVGASTYLVKAYQSVNPPI